MAYRQQSCDEICVSKRLLRLTWSSQAVRWGIAQSDRTAGCGPACPVVWQGRRGDSPPYADLSQLMPGSVVTCSSRRREFFAAYMAASAVLSRMSLLAPSSG